MLCLMTCSFKSTSTLIFLFAVFAVFVFTGTSGLATAKQNILLAHYKMCCFAHYLWCEP